MKYFIYRGEGNGELEKLTEVTDQKTYTVTGLKPKTQYRFAVSAYNGKRESAKSNIITINTASIPVSGVTLSVDTTSLEVGQTAKVSVTITPADTTDGSDISYATSNSLVASVDGNGTITAKSAGTATIYATVSGVKSNIVNMTIYEQLVDITSLTASNTTTTSTQLTWQ